MAELQIACFGDLQVKLAQTVLKTFPTDKARALLAYLASEGQAHQRTELAQFFWSGYSAESARNSLRQTIHQLRQLLWDDEADPPWLLLTRQTVQFNPAASIRSDVQDFTQLLAACTAHTHAALTTCATCLARLRQAAELYQGDFLAGLPVIDSSPFEEWRRLRQEQLRLQVLDSLNQLAIAAERTGDAASALWVAQRQVAIEPWLEAAHRQIMRILAEQGEQAAALAQYQRCQQVLSETWGAAPDAETAALYEEIVWGAGGRGQGAEGRGQKPEDSEQKPEGRGQKPEDSEQKPEGAQEHAVGMALHSRLDWGEMPAVDFFAGRAAEVAQLTAWLAPTAPTRIVSVLGMGGIGKTTLAAAVAKAVAPQFAVVIWRSLLNAPPLDELLGNWLQMLSRQLLSTLPKSLDEQLRLLVVYLRQERCLLVLDNVESIFTAGDPQGQAGAPRPGYEGYDQLLQRLASSEHQSCLLLTSREQPHALVRLGRQAQETTGRLRVLPLAGLDEQAGYALLQSNGLDASVQEAARLVASYSGNPLALQIVAGAIADFFGGDVAAFQQEAGTLFDGMRLVLDQQFARLSPLERDILVWLAIEREAITVPTLRRNFAQPVATASLLEALHALQNRSLLEKRDSGFTLQNVIIEYTTEYLVKQICQEIYDLRIKHYELREAAPDANLGTSFLNRFALLNAQAKQYVRQSQARLLLQPVAERLVTTVGRTQLVASIPYLLDALRAAEVKKGYAGGNLLNLLVQLGEELIGYDFSHLPVWQADLSGLTFVNADFTGADLDRSTFTAGITVNQVAFQPTGELWAAGIANGTLGLWRMIERQITDAFDCGDNLRSPLVFSPQGEFVATSTDDYRIKIWSTNSGECWQTLTGLSSTVHALAFSCDGAYLASFGADLIVYLWELQSGRCVQQLPGYKLGADALAFSPDGQLLATGGGDGQIQLWDTHSRSEAGHRVAAWQAHRQPLGALAFSPDGRWLASGSHAGEIRLWQVAPSALEQGPQRTDHTVDASPYAAGPICHGHTSIIRSLLFLPTGDPAPYLLASAGDDRTVRIWSLTGQLRYTLLGHTNAVLSLSASPDGRQLASAGADKQIFLWDVESGQAHYLQQAYRVMLQCLAFSPDGDLLASGGADQIVRLWQVDDNGMGQLRHSLRGHSHFIDSLAFSPDGQTIASGDADGAIRLWDRATGQALQTLREHQGTVRALTFAPTASLVGQNETLLASAGTDRRIRLWAVGAHPRREVRYLRQLIGHEAEILALAFDQRGRRLVSGCADGSLWIWDVQSGATLHRLSGHTAPVTAIAINLDDQTVASNSFDLTIRLWDLTTGACLHVERDAKIGPNGVVFSHDGQYLAYTGNDLGLYVWAWRAYAAKPSLPHEPLWGQRSTAYALCFRPTTPHLASCSVDGWLHLWDVVKRRCTQILRPPGPYAGMKITGVTGISEAQRASLTALGAVGA